MLFSEEETDFQPEFLDNNYWKTPLAFEIDDIIKDLSSPPSSHNRHQTNLL